MLAERIGSKKGRSFLPKRICVQSAINLWFTSDFSTIDCLVNTSHHWLLLSLLLAAGVGSYRWQNPPIEDEDPLPAMIRRITNRVDPHRLQAWALSAIQNERSRTTNESPMGFEYLSEFVRTNPPPGFDGQPQIIIDLGGSDADRASVRIFYPGGFLTWGVTAGAANFSLPNSRHATEWIPGVYLHYHP